MTATVAKLCGSLHVKSAGAPTDAQLSAIRQYTLADIPAESLYVRTFVVAHSAIDRDRECFDELLLADFARTLPGKGMFVKHPMSWDGDSGPGEGRWFAARTERVSVAEAKAILREPNLQVPPDRTDVTLLYADTYIAHTDDNTALRTKIDAGVVGDVSIGLTYADRQRLRDAEGRELNAFRLTGPGEALEASLVWLGAQPGARAVKQAPTNFPENDMDPKITDKANEEITSLKAKLEAADKSASSLAAIKSALGDDAALVDNPASLAECVRAGKSYRDGLIADIVASARQKGAIGDTDADVQAAKSTYAALPAAQLKVLADTLGATGAHKQAPASPSATAADPNKPSVGAKSADPNSPFANPLITG